MVLVSFSLFHDAVKFGNKRQTIRKLRKRPFVKGDRLDLYWKVRSHKESESFGSWTCKETFYVRMFSSSRTIQIGYFLRGECGPMTVHHTLTATETLDLAKQDGFNTAEELFVALERLHGFQNGSQIFQVIRW